MPGPTEPADAGALRFEQAIVALALLSAFVFRLAWVVPLVGVLILAALIGGHAGNVFARVYDAALAPRLGPRAGDETPADTRLTRAVEVVLLAAGSLLVVLGALGLAWVFALVVAAITVVAATTGINLVASARDRRGHRPH
jgi:Domain of unknown function (DUF4395)